MQQQCAALRVPVSGGEVQCRLRIGGRIMYTHVAVEEAFHQGSGTGSRSLTKQGARTAPIASDGQHLPRRQALQLSIHAKRPHVVLLGRIVGEAYTGDPAALP